ncbi:MAG: single-stranded-DNA-specific exonuclease RecJ, partial [Nevskiales bacterium]|nr:single-stranded-DNA-specific exonuclease RecJ [Nevskiales bacterium]
ELSLDLKSLLPPTLAGLPEACVELITALREKHRIVIAGDYDADGATSTALAVSTLRLLGADVDFVVPDRFKMGYGLTPGLVQAALAAGAKVLVTVDCGIASHAGVAAARGSGLRVIITDHHLPGPELPSAHAIVNPNCPGDPFPSKHLAGVGVMFYLLMALRARLREQNGFQDRSEPNLSDGLDLVALGTVADMVRLDHNNRILVAQGLRRLRAGRSRPGINALLQAAGRTLERTTAADLGFAAGPRLNAAGRLTDMRLGIRCLLAQTAAEAEPLAQELDRLNRERRELESRMQEQALDHVAETEAVGVCLFDPGWHEGVVGLVASRIKERLHRPVIAFARAHEPGMLKGSGRTIAGLHIRDALAAIDAQHPGLIERFGGHAMAAGLSLRESNLDVFATAYNAFCRQWLDETALEQVIETDGELESGEFNLDMVRALEQGGPWGQGCPEPSFDGEFNVTAARFVGQDHVRYQLRARDGQALTAIHFRGAGQAVTAGPVRLVYRPVVNRYSGTEQFELQVAALWSA